jgi:hypothetical protein
MRAGSGDKKCKNPAEAMGSYGGVLMLGRGRTDNLSPSQDTCSHAAETASARFSTLELSLPGCASRGGLRYSPSRCFRVLPYLIAGGDPNGHGKAPTRQ